MVAATQSSLRNALFEFLQSHQVVLPEVGRDHEAENVDFADLVIKTNRTIEIVIEALLLEPPDDFAQENLFFLGEMSYNSDRDREVPFLFEDDIELHVGGATCISVPCQSEPTLLLRLMAK